ncbi:Endo-1-3(4)-beta-glucanase [Penicillium paradoxum]|uniref:Endo-1-3(4)-beta-glucanase n=1 Tax=Penicillium paradoxum TaxID=176176 RepID=UPI0025469AC4|nr:Endo-1-3(4)-beta-glucanase [Penicillium paradoxum]KAJ5782671.1 Endo-1-3(4)-beta-glucanase [Penicillium paradoxum]
MRFNVLAFGVAVIYLGNIVSALAGAKAPQPPFKRRPRGCDCYTVSGPNPGYFQHYKLWDFRAVDLRKHAHLNMSEPIQDSDEEWSDDDEGDENEPNSDLLSGVHNGQEPDPSSLVFYKTAFERDWSSQNWKRPGSEIAPILMVNSKHNVFLTRDQEQNDTRTTYLVLRTTRFSNYTSTAEIETRLHNIYRCSLRVRLRFLPAGFLISQPPHPEHWPSRDPERHSPAPSNNHTVSHHDGRPSPGACAGIFTYHDQTCESDIEILTRDPPHLVHYANQPDYDFATDEEIPGASTTADLPVPWTTWSTHRLDWHSNMSRWFVNNRIQDAKSYRVPNLGSMIVLNLWSDGGVWTGEMKIGDSIYLGIEYIEMAYNRSSDVPRGHFGPSSLNHGGHQNVPSTNSSTGNDTLLDPDKKVEKCKPGRLGRECRRKKWRNRPLNEFCQRPCNIDED